MLSLRRFVLSELEFPFLPRGPRDGDEALIIRHIRRGHVHHEELVAIFLPELYQARGLHINHSAYERK